jgi:hypothetical protein
MRNRFAPGAVLALALLGLLPVPVPAQAASDLLPDLVAEPPAYPVPAQVERLADGREHLVIRFDGWIHNIGAGPLEIFGRQPVNGTMTITGQRIYRTDASFHDETGRHPVLRYENTDAHKHWHLQGAARYSIWNEGGTAQAAPSAKVGFCLLDSEHVDAFGPSAKVYSRTATGYCREGQPNVASVFEGISRGYRDYYPNDLPFQWVDVSDVAPGNYRLAAETDPDDFVVESNEANNGPALAAERVTVPGYTAAPIDVSGPAPHMITLRAQAYGSPGPPAFAIESPPAHGVLSALPGARVAYSPSQGFAGRDTFTYSVRDSTSGFPLHSSVAAVTVTVPSGATSKRTRLLTRVRLSRRGRLVRLRARAMRSGMLRIVLRKKGRRLGSCRHRARAGHRFTCRIKLRRRASLRDVRGTVTLLVNGRAAAVDRFRMSHR